MRREIIGRDKKKNMGERKEGSKKKKIINLNKKKREK
jgi:hypothetical protein